MELPSKEYARNVVTGCSAGCRLQYYLQAVNLDIISLSQLWPTLFIGFLSDKHIFPQNIPLSISHNPKIKS
jgi:hypothetical protein